MIFKNISMVLIKRKAFNIFRQFRHLKTYQMVLVIILIPILSIFLYIIFSLIIVSQAEIGLAELARSYQEDKFCRNECQEERRQIGSEITQFLKDKPKSRLSRRIKKYFLNPETSRDFKLVLVDISQEAAGPQIPPDYMVDYIKHDSSDPYVAARIYAKFLPESLTGDDVELDAGSQLELYFQILESQKAYPLKLAAIRQISKSNQIAGEHTLDQLSRIAHLLLSDEAEDKLKYHLVMLLSDYHQPFPEESSETLRTVYWSDESSDLVRALAGDLLNRYEPDGGPEGEGWEIPLVSEAEWEDYYSD